MAVTLKVIVAGFATFVEEFREEESVQEEEDVFYYNRWREEGASTNVIKVRPVIHVMIAICTNPL